MFKKTNILEGKVICISTSDNEDFYKPGTRNYLLNSTRMEIAQHLLMRGCTIAFGGDLRKGGFTETLIDLSETVIRPDSKRSGPALTSYLSWPSDIDLNEDQEARLSGKVRFVRAGLPPDIAGEYRPQFFVAPSTPGRYYIRARALTHMREMMNTSVDACIVLSGRMTGTQGKYPGVLEETYLAMQASKPVYLVSAFGGAAMEIAEALSGKTGNRISNKYQFMSNTVRENVRYFNSRHSSTIDYGSLSLYFNVQGVDGLNNQLSATENKQLQKSTDTSQIISLITAGLERRFSS